MSLKSIIAAFLITASIPLCAGCADDEYKEERDLADKLVEHIAKEDEKKLKAMFSTDALNVDDFDDGLEYAFNLLGAQEYTIEDFYTSEITEFYGIAGIRELIDVCCSVFSEDAEYLMFFQYYTKDYYNPLIRINFGKNVGKIKCLILIENTEDAFVYWEGHNVNRSGIYNPNWDADYEYLLEENLRYIEEILSNQETNEN